ncbi:hypothetical protein PGT21_026713 [Puccinia graminis f. sp. tritici]|uniref:Uncharacterized protein n=1 Tax=Puccinia graminis f. sp. tritici TaxID=56615 RepID=A0A5B0QVQ9_PUCGR|nr:hypothetical protein PGT21_026713 [Puccinia graminis f. sp. tritici]KAA1117015.1 hypothetical protein PGTUg99_034090 [Puccinia graminis f. sp. tritici]
MPGLGDVNERTIHDVSVGKFRSPSEIRGFANAKRLRFAHTRAPKGSKVGATYVPFARKHQPQKFFIRMNIYPIKPCARTCCPARASDKRTGSSRGRRVDQDHHKM